MGNSQTTPRRKLEHILPFLHNYKKLSSPPYSSSSSSPTHPLLHNNKEYDVQDTTLMEPYYGQKIETEDFLRKTTGVTDKDFVNLKSSLSKLEARLVSLTSDQSSLSKKLKDQEEASTKELSGLKRRVSDLERKLTSDERMKKEEKVIIEKLEKSNTAMDKKITELVATVQGLKTITSKTSTDLHEKTEEGDTNAGPRMSTPMDDLIGIILILIFLVSILIGINL